MSDEHSLMMHVSLSREEAEPGLAAFKAAVAAMPFTKAAVAYKDGTLHVNGTFTDESQSDKLSDLVLAAMRQAFPVLNEEIKHDDPILGSLDYLDDRCGFVGSIQLGDERDVEFVIESSPEPPPTESLARAQDIVKRWPTWSKAISARIVDELLELYNNTWRSMDEDATADVPLSAPAFLQRLSLYSLTIHEDRQVWLRYSADGMFTEHDITVSISGDDKIEAWME